MSSGPPFIINDFLRTCSVCTARLEKVHELTSLLERLSAANKVTNLTRITSAEDFWCKHIADSLSIGCVAPDIMTASYKVADVGCGAGFPLIPLAWANPRLRMTGIEPRQRKASFIDEIIRELGLQNCSVIRRQVREVGNKAGFTAEFDIITARAVMDTARLIKESRRLLSNRVNSRFILYKTPDQVRSERRDLERTARKYGFGIHYSEVFELPLHKGARQFIIAERCQT